MFPLFRFSLTQCASRAGSSAGASSSSSPMSLLPSLVPSISSPSSYPSSSSLSLSPLSFVPMCCSRLKHEKPKKAPPPQRSAEYFEELARQRRASAKATLFAPPKAPITFDHSKFSNPFFLEQRRANEVVAIKEVAETRAARDPTDPHVPATLLPPQVPEGEGDGSIPLPARPSRFAIFSCRGHQYKVVEGDLLMIPKYPGELGDEIIFNNVLALASAHYSVIGRPRVLHAQVHAVIEEHSRTEKIIVFHRKRRKNHRKTQGHRTEVTMVRIKKLVVPAEYAANLEKGEDGKATLAFGVAAGEVKVEAPEKKEKIPVLSGM